MKKVSLLIQTFLASLLALAVSLASVPAMASYTQSDLTNLNNAESPSKYNRTFGYRHGAGKCVFDPSATTASRTTGAHGCGLVVPKNAVVTRAVYKVLTTFTSPTTDDATIAIHIVAANDVVSAVSIDTATTWDAGIPVETIPVIETPASWLTTTANSEVTFTVGVEALTAGKMVLWVEWLYFGDA